MVSESSLVGSLGQVGGRNKFDVTLVWKNGDKQFFEDAVVHHVDGWLMVHQFTRPDWITGIVHGFRGDEVKSYTVKARD